MSRLQFVVIVLFLVEFGVICSGLPVLGSIESAEKSSKEENTESESLDELARKYNGTKDLYVIKAVVYEIGILTDSSTEDNSTDFESHERVDLTFFDAHKNDTHIDLGTVPLPIQTNISGQVLTGIAPVDIGAFSDASELLRTLPITGTIVNITHSDTGFFQLTTSNLTEYETPHILKNSELDQIPDIVHLLHNFNNTMDKTEASTEKSQLSLNLIK